VIKVNGNLQGVGSETALRSVLQGAQGQKEGSGNTGSLLLLNLQGQNRRCSAWLQGPFRALASQPHWETPVATEVG